MGQGMNNKVTTFGTVLFTGYVLFAADAQAAGDKEAGKEKAIPCQICHGKGGRSTNPLYPVLAGQHAQYIIKQLKAFKAGTRKDPIMNGMAEPLTDADMDDLAVFFQSNRNP
jgi:cytochrome c553